MASVEYAFPVDKIHGKISKSHKVGFAYRRASKLNYTTAYGKRSTAYSTDEIAHQNKFAAVSTATRARLKDPQYIQADQAAFKAQSEYATLYRYVWNQEWAAYQE